MPHVAKAGHNKHTVCQTVWLFSLADDRVTDNSLVEKACTVQDISNFAIKMNFNCFMLAVSRYRRSVISVLMCVIDKHRTLVRIGHLG